jgi:hypothetical protein
MKPIKIENIKNEKDNDLLLTIYIAIDYALSNLSSVYDTENFQGKRLAEQLLEMLTIIEDARQEFYRTSSKLEAGSL